MSPRARRDATTVDDRALQVRVARQEDAERIARIYNHYVDAGGATFDKRHWSEEETLAQIGYPEPDCWFVADKHREVLGWASVRRYSLRHGYRFTCETAIYLHPSAIGCGVGDRLQTRLEEHCRQCDIHHAVAKIVADNRRSMAFHYRHGYELVGIQREVGNIEGKWIDVAILQKIFSNATSGPTT